MSKTISRRKPISNPSALPRDLHPVLRRILAARPISGAHELERTFKHLLPYDALSNLNNALILLHQALKSDWRILIVGDFDADGATSTTVALKSLSAMGAKYVDYLVPNRFEFGYGLTPEIIEVALKNKPDLIITVDNGISSIAGVEFAHQHNIKVIITDHHLPGKVLPDAEAIINPNLEGDNFPSKNLAGVGVIFYTMLALRAYLKSQNWFVFNKLPLPNLTDYLDLVALGTVADIVPLDHNNRILVHQGLLRIRKGMMSVGVRAILDVANRKFSTITATDLGFAVGPRLNAAGRLEDMSIGIQCLLTNNKEEARHLAQTLDGLNVERKAIETEMKAEAEHALDILFGKMDKTAMPSGICVFKDDWHQGVIGILAARLKERYYRPVIAFAPGGENELKGSGRSIPGVHMRDLLDAIATKNPDLINKFGGHAMAAGLSLAADKFDAFEQAFNQEIDNWVSEDLLKEEILTDGRLALDEFNMEIASLISGAGPWGQAFPEPQFDGKFQLVRQRLVGDKHLKMTVVPINEEGELGQHIDAIAFNVDLSQWPNECCQWVNLAYKLDINEYMGVQRLQLIVQYLESCDC